MNEKPKSTFRGQGSVILVKRDYKFKYVLLDSNSKCGHFCARLFSRDNVAPKVGLEASSIISTGTAPSSH